MASPASPPAVAPTTAAELFDLVHKSGLHKPDYLNQKIGECEFPADAAGAAGVLIRAGLLTQFQAKLLLAGKYRGFKLGTYLIRDQIGKGGMGTVYLAEHATLRRKVALKVLAADANQKASVERFLREARAAAALDHPNIVRVFDVLQSGELHYIVMEYVEGRTLDSLVQGGGAMAPGRAVTYISQAAAGLQHAYEKGFVHRDIKPANLMVSKDGTVKVLDMGLARSTVDDGDRVTEVLDEGAVVGTADYISPEQATNQPGVDIRADIYSLGATLFALVTGQPPFVGSTSQVLMQHQLKPAPSLADFDRTIAPGLAAVVAKMLAKKPAERFHTPAEVIAALAPWLPNRDGAQKVMAGLSSSEMGRSSGTLQNTLDQVLSSGTTGNLPRPAGSGSPLKPAILGGVVAVGLLVLGGIGYAVLGGGGAKQEVAAAATRPAAVDGSAAVRTAPAAAPVSAVRPTTRPVSKPAVASSALYTLDLSAQQPFVDRGRTSPDWKWRSEQKTGTGSLPPGWQGFLWNQESEGEYFAEADGGRMVLGMRTLTGTGSAMLFTPPIPFAGPVPVAVEYRTELGSPAEMFVRFVQTGPTLVKQAVDVVNLPPTNGEWKTGKFDFDPKASSEGFLEFHDHQLGANHAIRIRALTVGGGGEPAAGKPVLFAFDAGSLPEFRVPLGLNKADGEIPGSLPNNVFAGCYKDGATGELVRTTRDGQPALGLASRTGTPSAQIVFPIVSDDLEPGREYVLRVTYQTSGDVGGYVLVQNTSDNYSSLGEVRFDPAATGWQTIEVKVKRPAGAALKVAFQSSRASAATTDMAYVRSVEVIDPTAVKPLFRLDPADLQSFRYRQQNRRTVGGTDGKFPPGTGLMAWKPETEAEFANDPVDGRPAFSLTNLTGPVSAQLMLNLESSENGMGLTLEPNKGYELRFDYKTTGGATARVYTQTTDYKTTNEQTTLPDTGGEWRPFAVAFTRGTTPLRMLVDADGSGAGKTLYLGAVELVEAGAPAAAPAVSQRTSAKPPAPAATPVLAAPPAVALGKKLFAIDLAGLPTFRGKFADGKPDGDFPTSRPGLSWYCWKKESVAEFRGEPSDRGPALGVTNLNNEVSSQFNLPLDDGPDEAKLQAGRRYVLRVQYRTSNDAAGQLLVRTPDYNTLARAELPATSGAWNWAEVSFGRADAKLQAVLENTSVGEGNTLWLRAAELHEAK